MSEQTEHEHEWQSENRIVRWCACGSREIQSSIALGNYYVRFLASDNLDALEARLEAAKKLRGRIGLAYISERAVFDFIREWDALSSPDTGSRCPAREDGKHAWIVNGEGSRCMACGYEPDTGSEQGS